MFSLPQQIESLQDHAVPATSSDEPVQYGAEARTPISTVTIIDGGETLEGLEGAIDSALAKQIQQIPIYMEIGSALIQIHDRQMWGSCSFEIYTKRRFGFGRSNTYDYINAATVGRALQSQGKPLPVSIRAALALIPKKQKPNKAAEPAYIPPENSTPVREDPSHPAPTMQANLLSLFRGVDVVINDSSTPGRWHLNLDVEDATTDQVRGIAMVLTGKQPTPELVTDSYLLGELGTMKTN